MLNGTIPATASMRCACGIMMPANDYGRPCNACMEDICHQDQLEEAACDYAATHGRDYILMQDGGID